VNYYILAFYLKYFPGNIFWNSFTMAFSDICSYLLAGYVLKKVGLTKSIISSLLTAALGSILYLFFFSSVSVIPLFIILCRVGNSMLLNIVYVTNSTLFPTQFAASSFGILNFISHVSAVCAPLFAELPDPYPFFIYLINCVIAMVCSFFIRQINQEGGEKATNKVTITRKDSNDGNEGFTSITTEE
jgi:MFS family permease